MMDEFDEFDEIHLPRKIYEMIEKKVVSLYCRLNLTQVPIDPFQIANRLGFVVKTFSDLPDEKQAILRELDLDGFSFIDSESRLRIICYDDNRMQVRIRFTIMHEIGHILLGHREESDLAKKMADYFAAYSLAPSPLMNRYRCDDYIDVMDTFDVSQDCAYICFQRFNNWLHYGGSLKRYEMDLLDLFS